MLAAWTAYHDNGWVATVLETPSGSFSAWLAREGEALSVDYADEGPENAKIAAEVALRAKTGHLTCSDKCSGWQLHTHELSITAEE
jgi:regulation of enolase protein 1 (concanavalin A-like superfamily)